ncbi:MAG: complex I 51 kDa subunit family protein [Acidimicrobiales bacterium]
MAVRSGVRLVSARLDDRRAHTFDRYTETGGYQALPKALTEMSPTQVHDEVRKSGLSGRSGGQAFPTAAKWDLVGDATPRYVIVNGDESEPGFFKDRTLMEVDPHQLVEGALLCAYVIGAPLVVIYIRGEMGLAQERVTAAVNDAYANGVAGDRILGTPFSCEVVVHSGAGAYVVGEETALIESLEGKRGFPRIKPPFYPAVIGLYGKPTVVNNVETLSTLPWIVNHGGDAYAAYGGGRFKGTRLFCLSGRINRPGTYELELHHPTFRDLFYDPDLGGGIRDGGNVKAFIPGASFPWFFEEQLDLHLDGDEVGANGSSLGSGIIVLDGTTCPVRLAWRLVRFFAHESCGQCTPCREGTGWLEKIMHRIENGAGRTEDLDLLLDVGENISPAPFPHPTRLGAEPAVVPFPYKLTTICWLGPSAVSPIESSVWRFRDDYLHHIKDGGCPYHD